MLDEAIYEYKKAIAIEPNNPTFHSCLGIAYSEKGMLDQAISEHKKAIAIDPNNSTTHYNLGLTYSDKGMIDKAIDEYKKAITIDPNFADAHNNLAVVYGKKGFNSLVAEYFYRAGSLYLKQDDREGALRAYEALKATKSNELAQALYVKLYPELKQESEPSK